ncbi:UNVERIFIED_CONTAM: hypothetical protein H355_015651 [Colinus virginianus]|nr:hypothetical protein H355_015651 [Colinus virginianus]
MVENFRVFESGIKLPPLSTFSSTEVADPPARGASSTFESACVAQKDLWDPATSTLRGDIDVCKTKAPHRVIPRKAVKCDACADHSTRYTTEESGNTTVSCNVCARQHSVPVPVKRPLPVQRLPNATVPQLALPSEVLTFLRRDNRCLCRSSTRGSPHLEDARAQGGDVREPPVHVTVAGTQTESSCGRRTCVQLLSEAEYSTLNAKSPGSPAPTADVEQGYEESDPDLPPQGVRKQRHTCVRTTLRCLILEIPVSPSILVFICKCLPTLEYLSVTELLPCTRGVNTQVTVHDEEAHRVAAVEKALCMLPSQQLKGLSVQFSSVQTPSGCFPLSDDGFDADTEDACTARICEAPPQKQGESWEKARRQCKDEEIWMELEQRAASEEPTRVNIRGTTARPLLDEELSEYDGVGSISQETGDRLIARLITTQQKSLEVLWVAHVTQQYVAVLCSVQSLLHLRALVAGSNHNLPPKAGASDNFGLGKSTENTTNIVLIEIGNGGMANEVHSTQRALVAAKFEVFGKVQGVFFRAHTKEKAMELGLVGYCLNTSHGSVLGEVQGPEADVQIMLDWLRTTGSPKSIITDCRVLESRRLSELSYSSFTIMR